MSKFEKLGTAETIRAGGVVVKIEKFKKQGTGRIFFTPEIQGKRIISTMYARLYDAKNLARHYLKTINPNNEKV